MARRDRTGFLEGPRLVAVAGGAALAVIALVVARAGTDVAGLRAGIRASAQTSLALFLPVVAASSLVRLAPRPATKWLLRNRRYLGLSMALSHLGHAVLIAAVAAHDWVDFRAHLAGTTLVGGGLGYVLLAAMVATSTDGAQRRLGRRRWRALHVTGMYALWFIFTFTYAPRAHTAVTAAVATAGCLCALALRVAARVQVRARAA